MQWSQLFRSSHSVLACLLPFLSPCKIWEHKWSPTEFAVAWIWLFYPSNGAEPWNYYFNACCKFQDFHTCSSSKKWKGMLKASCVKWESHNVWQKFIAVVVQYDSRWHEKWTLNMPRIMCKSGLITEKCMLGFYLNPDKTEMANLLFSIYMKFFSC